MKYPLLTGDSPVYQGDNYGKQKVECENQLKASSLPWTIIRFPAVMGIGPNANQHPDTMRFTFLLPIDRKEHAIDVCDAALAVVNAIEANTNNKTPDLGGDETWKHTAGEIMDALFEARGLKPLPDSAYRKADPEVNESWYYEGWIDTNPSEGILKYQKHSFDDYLKELRKNVGIQRYLLKIIGALIQKKILKDSPFYGKPENIDSRPFWESLCDEFNLKEDN
jgi:nucleoside-diphosphate-sugar epimerase